VIRGGRPAGERAPRRDRWHLQLTEHVAVSFQRFAWPPGGHVPSAPASLGALPIARLASDTALLPVAAGEAFWIGLDPHRARPDTRLQLRAQLASGRAVDVLSGREWSEDAATLMPIRARPRIEGIARPDGAFDVLGRAPADGEASCIRLSFRVMDAAGSTRVDVEIFDPPAFRQRSGDEPPPPLDPAAGYRGHRLP
jgi:hypothetical protein